MNNTEEFDILAIIHKLWERKFFLAFCTFIPAIIAMIVSFLIPKKYTSSVTILAPEVASGGGIIQTPFGGFSTSGLSGDIISSQALVAIIKSDEMIENVIKEFNLAEKLKFKSKRALIKFVRNEVSSTEILADEGTVTISVCYFSPEESKEILEFYLSNLENLNRKLKLTTQTPIVKILSPPFLPERKSFPKTKFNMAIAGLGGLICGLLFLYFRERTANIT